MRADALEVHARPRPNGFQTSWAPSREGAIADHPDWMSCWCRFLYVDHATVEWMERTAEGNRGAARARICKSTMHAFSRTAPARSCVGAAPRRDE